VALARALARDPEVLLLDEPFGALDAWIRAELRRALKAIQREVKITTILVTHDQEEAFELADQIAVMNLGRVLETGAPEELYFHPRTEFVASFLGTANLISGERDARGVKVGPLRFPLAKEVSEIAGARRVEVLFRPEDVVLAPSAEALGDAQPLGMGAVER